MAGNSWSNLTPAQKEARVKKMMKARRAAMAQRKKEGVKHLPVPVLAGPVREVGTVSRILEVPIGGTGYDLDLIADLILAVARKVGHK